MKNIFRSYFYTGLKSLLFLLTFFLCASETQAQCAGFAVGVDSVTVVKCQGDSTGRVVLKAIGGAAPFQFAFNTNAYQSSALFANLPSGPYTFHVKDANNCVADTFIYVEGPEQAVSGYVQSYSPLCAGSSGSVTIEGIGGWQPATYTASINGGVFFSVPSTVSLAVGSYFLTIQDSLGCSTSDSFQIEPYSPNFNFEVLSPTCTGEYGTLFVYLPYSGPAITVNYSPNATQADSTTVRVGTRQQTVSGYSYYVEIDSLIPGPQTVIITRYFPTFSCSDTLYQNISVPLATVFTATPKAPSCNDGTNGSIKISVTDGIAPYTYSRDGITYAADSVLTGFAAGVYTVYVKNDYGCVQETTVTVSQPAVLTLQTLPTNVACNGGNTGSITVNGVGGTAPYQYAIGNFSFVYGTNNTFSNLAAGTYTVNIKDTNNCTAQIPVTLTQPANALLVSAVKTNVLCKGETTGTITATGSGGTPPYTFAIDAGAYTTAASLTGIAAGNHTVRIKDAANCTAQITVTITEPALVLGVAGNVSNVTCNSTPNGSIAASGIGGTAPYQFAINANPFSGTSTFTNLAAGTYTVRIKDFNNCTAQTTVTITQPAALAIATTLTNVSCNDAATGSIAAAVTGGTAPYQYALNSSNFSTGGGNFSNLPAGSYTVRVRDANNCTTQTTVTITQPAVLSVATTQGNVGCNNGATGSITASGIGGTAPYQFALNGGTFSGSNTFTNLAAGSYVVRIKDGNNCTAQITVIITQSPALTLGSTQTNVACNGGATGSITATGTGGNPPYTYAIDAGTFSGNNIFTNLTAGTYTVRIKDAANCTAQLTVTITQPAALGLGSTQTNVACNGGTTGSITASGTGGTLPYTYALDGGAYSSSNTFTNLVAGTYTVRIKDATNCTAQIGVTITQPPVLTLFSNPTNVACNGGTTGSFTTTGSGGTAPYQYAISSTSFSYSGNNTFSNLAAGSYTVRVKDANNCVAQAVVTITEPTALSVANTQTNVGCNGSATGSITASGTGGTLPYTYALNAGTYSGTNTFTNLAAGSYTVRIKDANNCTAQATVIITQPAVLGLGSTQTNVACNGGTTGSITASGTGGTLPYTYALDGGAYSGSNTFANLTAGTYTIRIKDAANCTAQLSVTVTQPIVLSVLTTQTNVSCNGGNNGSIGVTGSGGTPPYTYAIGTGTYSATNSFNNLATGTYVVNIKDAANCTAQTTVTLSQPTPLNVSLTPTNVACNGGSTGSISASGSGGVAPYIYALNTGAYSGNNTFTGLTAGSYTVQIKDGNNCTAQATVTVTAPALLALSVTGYDVTCNGGNNGSVGIAGTGGTAPYTYALNAGAYSSANFFTNLSAGSYVVRIKDAANCTAQTTLVIAQPPLLVLSTVQTNLTCSDIGNGTITASGTGGVPPYTYALNNPNFFTTTGNFVGLGDGTYTVFIKDANGCTQQKTVILTAPPQLTISGTPVNVLCNGAATGSITVTAAGGTGSYNYALNGGNYATSNIFTGLTAGVYTIRVKDANGCLAAGTITITQSAPLVLNAQVTPVTCNGTATGRLDAAATGGTSPYTYSLNGSAFTTNSTFSGLAAGTYVLDVKDANNCTTRATLVVTQPTLLAVTFSLVQPVCFGLPTGSIVLTATGGNPPYTYLWSTGDVTATVSNLKAGLYRVTTTDAKGCTRTDSATLVNPTEYRINLGPDRTLCRAQTLELNASINVAGTQYQWSSSNGFSSAEPTVTIRTSGTYRVLATTPLGCEIADTLNVEISTDTIVSDFVAATQAFKDSVYTMVNISAPTPDSVVWILPPADKCRVRSIQKGAAEVVFLQAGVYEIGLKTFLGACFEITTKKVIVVEGAFNPALPVAQTPFIKQFEIAPNPSSGVFEVRLELEQATDANLLVIDANTGIVADRKLLVNVEKQTVAYSLNLSQGTYILLLKTAQASRSLKLLIQ